MKILIRATNWVGDAIIALPALRAVRGRFPEATIAIVARPYVADIYRGQEICDELIADDPKGAHAGLSGRERLAKELRARKFDVALLLQNAFDAAWLAWRAGIPERIGYARDGRSLLLTSRIAVPSAAKYRSTSSFTIRSYCGARVGSTHCLTNIMCNSKSEKARGCGRKKR